MSTLSLLSFATALTAGFAGSAHCLVMCGGLAAARNLHSRLLLPTLLQQLGRISSYTIAGALAGGLTQGAQHLAPPTTFETPLRIAAGLITLLVAIRVLGGRNWLAGVERLGALLWRRLQPLTRSAIQGSRWYHAALFGMAWGWLPCGMVYSALLLASTSGNSLRGAGMMLAFGLGTAPALLFSSVMAARVPHLSSPPSVRALSGALLLLLAAWTLLPPLWLPAHHVH